MTEFDAWWDRDVNRATESTTTKAFARVAWEEARKGYYKPIPCGSCGLDTTDGDCYLCQQDKAIQRAKDDATRAALLWVADQLNARAVLVGVGGGMAVLIDEAVKLRALADNPRQEKP